MSGKLDFGCDYLFIMRDLILRGEDEPFDQVCDAAARIFLLDWGFTVGEIDQANNLWHEKVNNNTLGDFNDACERIISYTNKDRTMQDRLIIEMAAIADFDNKITDEEKADVYWFQNRFDIRPSEFSSLCEKGVDKAIALNFFGDLYKKLVVVKQTS